MATLKAEDIKYDTPIAVSSIQFNRLMDKCAFIIAGRRDSNGQYWIKVWNMSYVDYVVEQSKV